MYKRFEPGALPLAATDACQIAEVPRYLIDTYWWAYIHPRAVRFFDRALAVNLILLGNYRRLRDAALHALGARLRGRTLQVACVYGDFTTSFAARLAPDARLDVVDVLPIQLENLRRKLPPAAPVALYRRDSAALGYEKATFDQAVVFFLLHEQPSQVRRQTLAEVLRVVKPGGRIVVVDYHRPHRLNPLRLVIRPLLARLEPFALDLWREEVGHWLPQGVARGRIRKTTFFGGLYQRVVIDL
jgi:ubiquinone/menaquinone biosynthesis C-methylase UbiE